MAIFYLILIISFIGVLSQKTIENDLEDGKEFPIYLKKSNKYLFYLKMNFYQSGIIHLSFDSVKYQLSERLTFYEFQSESSVIYSKTTPFTEYKGNRTTLAAIIYPNELKTNCVALQIIPKSEIGNATILAKINYYDGISKNVKISLTENKIINLDTLYSNNFYLFSLTTHQNNIGKIELIFDTTDYSFNTSYLLEYQYGTSAKYNDVFFLHFTETKQGNKTILTSSHFVSNHLTRFLIFKIKPESNINNVNIIGTVIKPNDEYAYKYRLSLNDLSYFASMSPSNTYCFQFPIIRYQTDQIIIKIGNISSLDYFSQPLNIYQCKSTSFKSCIKVVAQYFNITKSNDSRIILNSYYKNYNLSMKYVMFEFQPLYNFYDVKISGSVKKINNSKSDSNSKSDTNSNTKSDTNSNSKSDTNSNTNSNVNPKSNYNYNSLSTGGLLGIVITSMIISIVILFVLYIYCYKRPISDEVNLMKNDLNQNIQSNIL